MSYILSIDEAAKWFSCLADAVKVENTETRTNKLRELYCDIKESNELRNMKAIFDEGLYPPLPAAGIFERNKMAELVMENGALTNNVEHLLVNNPLAQLLYSVAWKNGDLRKFNPLKHGLTDDDGRNIRNIENGSYVFYQYGKHILDRGQPIVDQHTGRAFKYMKVREEKGETLKEEDIREIREYKKLNEQDYIGYLGWVDKVLPSNLEDRDNILSCLDKIMFSLGKALSKTHRKKK